MSNGLVFQSLVEKYWTGQTSRPFASVELHRCQRPREDHHNRTVLGVRYLYWKCCHSHRVGTDSAIVIAIITIMDTMTRMSGITENFASPWSMCRLIAMNLIPENRVATAARKKENKLRYTMCGDAVKCNSSPPNTINRLMNISKRSITNPNARRAIPVRAHERKVLSLAI